MTVDRATREAYILDLLAKDGSLSVSALSKDLGVSEVTIRSNLKGMEERGLLTRTHGGAQPATLADVLERRREHAAEKERIAEAAAALITDGDRVMIEAGTTCALIPKYLSARKGVQIVTNSTLLLAQARLNPQLTVILTGGHFHRESESMIGPVALRAVRDFNVRFAFVGTDGFTSDRGITTQFAQGAEVISAMAARAEETWLLADSSKYGRAGFVSVLGLHNLTGIITDDGLGPDSVAALQESAPIVRVV